MTTQATGRRKTSVAQIALSPGKGSITINKKPLEVYFPNPSDRTEVLKPLKITEKENRYDCKIHVQGGGITGQKEAIQHGISRAMVTLLPELRMQLKKEKLLTRDPRTVERKKYGHVKARKSTPFRKR